MRVLHAEPAVGSAALAAATSSSRVTYASTSVRGEPVEMTGLVHLPPGEPPDGGWPVVTYGHMTTGAGARGAPSLATPDHPELRRMTQGDVLVSHLLEAGVVVLRPDYEGIGGPGPHPYLIGRSLATATLDLLAAARAADPRLGPRWVSAGHSEGSVAALFAAGAHRDLPVGVSLRAVAAFAPVSRMDLTIGAFQRLPLAVPGWEVVVPLIALMVAGAATVDDDLAALVASGGLSAPAVAMWPQLAHRSLEELARRDSWGGLAPSRLTGPRGAELRHRLFCVLRANDVRDVVLRPGVPVRIDAGLVDEVAPLPITESLVRRYRRAGVDVTYRRWRASHSGVMGAGRAPGPAARWIVQHLRLP